MPRLAPGPDAGGRTFPTQDAMQLATACPREAGRCCEGRGCGFYLFGQVRQGRGIGWCCLPAAFGVQSMGRVSQAHGQQPDPRDLDDLRAAEPEGGAA